MTDNCFRNVSLAILNSLKDCGMPVDSIQPTKSNYKDQFSVQFKVHDDLISLADSFTLSKMLIKMICLHNETDISFIPLDHHGGAPNHLAVDLNLDF